MVPPATERRKKIIRPGTGPKPARVKPSPFTAPDSDGMKALSECKLERLLAQRAAASANFLTKEMPSPRDSNQRVRSRNRDTAFQARLQREDISRLLVSEERSERRRRGVRLYQDSDAAFASAFGGTVAETTSTSSSSSTALAFLLLLPKQI